jgi:hypothetical protein
VAAKRRSIDFFRSLLAANTFFFGSGERKAKKSLVRSFIAFVKPGFGEDQADQQKGSASGREAMQHAQSPGPALSYWWHQLEYRTPEFATCICDLMYRG